MATQDNLALHLCKAHLELGTSVVTKLRVAHFDVTLYEDSMTFCAEKYTREECQVIGVNGREFDILRKSVDNFQIGANVPESAASLELPISATPKPSSSKKGGKRISLFQSVSPINIHGFVSEDIISPYFKLNDPEESTHGNACILAFVNLFVDGCIVLSDVQTRVLARLVTVMTIGRLVRWTYTQKTKRQFDSIYPLKSDTKLLYIYAGDLMVGLRVCLESHISSIERIIPIGVSAKWYDSNTCLP
jgi:hypothetical protein